MYPQFEKKKYSELKKYFTNSTFSFISETMDFMKNFCQDILGVKFCNFHTVVHMLLQ